MNVLLLSTYELGRQPFGLASPAAWLRRAGVTVVAADLSRQPLPLEAARAADLVAFYLPMHTATRLAVPVIARLRQLNPDAHLCCYGLYAPLNNAFLRAQGVETIIGPEFEQALVDLCQRVARTAAGAEQVLPVDSAGSPPAVAGRNHAGEAALPRLKFITPDRTGLPPLGAYATLAMPDGASRVVGYTEASRGCKHRCRHCPIVPVYDGQFRAVSPEVVLADIAAQVAAGATHVTFGDADFFNGVTHALRIVNALPYRFPGLTYDVTIKIEHLLAHRDALPRLRETGCLFVTSAVESVDDRVLALLEKGHTRADFVAVTEECQRVGLTLVPTFVPFTPWTTLRGYCELLDVIDGLKLVDHVAPIQLAIRLLIPEGSRLLELADIRSLVGRFDGSTLVYPWRHPDAEVDDLQADVMRLVAEVGERPRVATFDAVSAIARARAGLGRAGERPRRQLPATALVPSRSTVPYLNEPWYC